MSDEVVISYDFINDKLAENLDDIFGVKNSFIEVNPGKVLLPPKFKELGQQILDFKVRPDDIWLICYPRSGSTWLQEMIWLICNQLDFQKAKDVVQQERFPYLELSAILVNHFDSFMESYGNSVEKIAELKSPRCIKTHIPLSHLPVGIKQVKPKIIYILRNPKDLCVSYFHYLKLVHRLNTDFETFCDMFLKGQVPWGSYWNNVLGYWNERNNFNILFLKYEELKTDLRGSIRKVANFLEKEITDRQISDLESFLSFENMKLNPSVNLELILNSTNKKDYNKNEGFIRKGQIGDWKNYMDDDLAEKFDEWIDQHIAETGLNF